MGVSLKVVSTTATAILALEAGAELNLKKMRPVMRTLRSIVVFAVIGAMFVMAGVLMLMKPLLPFLDGLDFTQSLAVCTVVGFALSAQSPAVVMAMLSETRADGPLSQVMLATVVVADLAVIALFSVASAIAGAVIGGGVNVAATAFAVSWELFGSIAFGLAIGALIGQFLLSVKGGASLFALMICVVVAEIGGRVHLDPLIVMLAAGIWLRNFSRADASHLLHGFESAQLPVFLVFFALAGSKLDIYGLWDSIIAVTLIAVVRAAVFYVGVKFACKRADAPEVVTKYAWFGLVPQAGLSLALVIVIQKTFPSFGNSAALILLSVVGVNQVLAPVMLRAALVRSGEAGKKAGVDFATDDDH
jgi:Kef-type K+ transport system membrane component KefB